MGAPCCLARQVLRPQGVVDITPMKYMNNNDDFTGEVPPGEPFMDHEAEHPPRVNVRLPPREGCQEPCCQPGQPSFFKNMLRSGRRMFNQGNRGWRRNWPQVTAPGWPDWLTPGFRLRPRGRLTRTLESIVKRQDWSKLVGGQTSPDFSVSGWMAAVRGRGGKVVGYHRVMSEGTEESPPELLDNMVVLSDMGHETPISLALLAKLSVYVTYRERTQELILALRARASQYAKEIGLSSEYLAVVIAGTVALAHLVGQSETNGWRMLGGHAGRVSEEWSDKFASGKVEAVGVVWPVVMTVLVVTCLAMTVDLWIGAESGWLSSGWGLLGLKERQVSHLLAWRAARRITGPFGLTIDRGLDPRVAAAYATWTVTVLATIAWAIWPKHIRDRAMIFGRSGRRLSKGGK